MATYKELVGSRIKAWREAAGFATQTELADKMGISPSRVSDWENGKHEPKGELKKTLFRLIKATDADIFEFDLERMVLAPPPSVDVALAKAVAKEVVAAISQEKRTQPDPIMQKLISLFEGAPPTLKPRILTLVEDTITSDQKKRGMGFRRR